MGEQSRNTFDLKVNFSASCGKDFKRALPDLRKKLGKLPFTQDSKCTYGVGGNTFRAYTGLDTPPSKAYRDWASKVSKDFEARALAKQIATAEGFEVWHSSLALSLEKHWKKVHGSKFKSPAYKYKLLDLFVKWLSGHDFQCPELTKAFENHAHCALDSQTLEKINACMSYALPLKKPSMGDITTETAYDFCQQLIAGFTRSQGGSALLFDYHSWKSGGSGEKAGKAKSA